MRTGWTVEHVEAEPTEAPSKCALQLPVARAGRCRAAASCKAGPGAARMSIGAQITDALAREFALPGVQMSTVILARLLVAAVLGGLVGLERERKRRAAGLKTHTLVSAGSALFVMAPLMAGIDPGDVTRVMQGIVSGIGFLGAGAILKAGPGERVKGLTTAAGIWTTSAIGMSAGMGLHAAALATTLVALAVYGVLPRVFPGSAPGRGAADG